MHANNLLQTATIVREIEPLLLSREEAAKFLGGISVRCLQDLPIPVIKIGARAFHDVNDLRSYVEGVKVQPRGKE
jgi:hypothetical protein